MLWPWPGLLLTCTAAAARLSHMEEVERLLTSLIRRRNGQALSEWHIDIATPHSMRLEETRSRELLLFFFSPQLVCTLWIDARSRQLKLKKKSF